MQKISETNFQQMDDFVLKKDFKAVLENKELFWMLFCTSYCGLKKKSQDSDCFTVQLKERNLIILGRPHIVKNINMTVEKIRIFTMEAFNQKKDFTFVSNKMACDIHFRKDGVEIDFSDWLYNKEGTIFESWYGEFFAPTLAPLFNSLGAAYSVEKQMRSIKNDLYSDGRLMNENVNVHKVEWKNHEVCVYPIVPKSLPSCQDAQNGLFELYEKQKFCDFFLHTQEAEVIGLHKVILYLNGGETLKHLIDSNFKEAKENKLVLDSYSTQVVRYFVDYIYLGPENCLEKMIENNFSEPYQLFTLAHFFQVTPLIDCCTNYISLIADTQDLPTIRSLANDFKNQHLKALAFYLTLEELD